MRKFILMMVLAVVSNSAMAEFTCEKIKDKATRTSCIKDRVENEKAAEAKKELEAAEKEMAAKHAEEARITAAQRDNEVKAAENLTKSKRNFDNALRSALALSAATEVGVSYTNFGGLLNNLATEIAMVKGQGTTPFETDSIDNLNKILDIYKDSMTLWADLIHINSGAGIKLNDDYIIFGYYPVTAEIIRKYDLPITKDKSGFFDGPDSLYGPGARSILWKNASSLVEILRASIQ